jgi:hypothetical protein
VGKIDEKEEEKETLNDSYAAYMSTGGRLSDMIKDQKSA